MADEQTLARGRQGADRPLGTVALASVAEVSVAPVGKGRLAAFPRQSVRFPNPRADRRARLPLRLLSFLALVALPIVAAAIYYFAIAADQYVCEFRFGLRSAAPVAIDPTALFPISGAISPASVNSQIVVQYIASRAIVDALDGTIDLRRIFSWPQADRLSRLTLPVSIERLVFYWKRQVDAFYETADGTIVVRVRAFTPHDSLTIANAILAASETLINALSARARRDAVRQSEAEAAQAEARLQQALAKLRDFRNTESVIDPNRAADATAAIAARVRDALVAAEAERATLQTYMRDDAPSLKILDARIGSLEAQWRALTGEITATDPTRADVLSRSMGTYEQLDSDRKFAETAYQHALDSLDRARLNADRQQVYVASFVPPALPEEALYPRRWRALGIVSLIAFAIWAIGGLTLQSVRDHL